MKKIKNLSLTTPDLVTIGVFAALAKTSSLLIALAGGGMNPLSMILRNLFIVVLLSALVVKVSKPWTLTLAHLTSLLVSALILGQSIATIPLILVACLVSELFLWVASRGYRLTFPIILGVFFCEIFLKVISAFYTYWRLKEQPMVDAMMTSLLVFMGIGIIGSVLGIFVSYRFIKELRRASLIFH